ncbi:hypothetical protein [uncultured Williamsia sp.]|uniref:hypothetical protein n=1 Tax=uncultured Williamsia sp. TaxID=259311 RepID=UPI00261735D9|nr:hypothetical protein [uncultured Williamsia sp.]
MSVEREATVVASTLIPSTSPVTGEKGYSVAWVDTDAGREQVLVRGERPSAGTRGRVVVETRDDGPPEFARVEWFVAGGVA